MLIRLLKSVFAMVPSWYREARQRPARALMGKAVRAYLASDLEVAKAKCDEALSLAPALSDVWYWCGKEDPESGHPRAAVALIHTLNHNWAAVIPEASAAKRLGAHLFPECNDFCLLAAALGLGKQPGSGKGAVCRGPDSPLRLCARSSHRD